MQGYKNEGDRMATPARIRANNKYAKKAYDQVRIAVRKGWKDKVKKAAEEAGESMTEYIRTAVENRMKEHQ